jgi:hypothetical protein
VVPRECRARHRGLQRLRRDDRAGHGDGAEVVNAVGDRVRAEFYRRVGLADLLAPTG